MVETSSIALIFTWIALAVLMSWMAPETWRMPLASLCGAGLLASLSPISLAFLGVFTIASYRVGRLRRHQKPAGICLILLLIALYLWLLWQSAASQSGSFGRILLPFGMAYYVLRVVHYLLEVGRGTIRQHGFLDYACYQFFAPTLPVGPIHRFDTFLRDLRRRRWDPDLLNVGLSRILMGATKIILLGNYLLSQTLYWPMREMVQSSPWASLYVDTILYWLNIYIQFAGYSDVAIGAGAVMGFHIPENFNFPFLARNISDFWRRWHMTLSGWCRDYIFKPVLAQFRQPILAFSTSMIALGLWHAVSLHYILWGFYHAIGLTIWRRFEKMSAGWQERLSRPALWLWDGCARFLTLNFVICSYPVANAIERLILRS